MIEKLAPGIVQQALLVGARADLCPPSGAGPLSIPCVVSAWSGNTIMVTLASTGPDQVLNPGMEVKLVSHRLDGVYHLHGKVQEQEGKAKKVAPGPNTVVIEVNFDLARRIQGRSFYRLSGSWPAVICIRPPASEKEVTACLHRAQAWNLSGGGALVEDFDNSLAEGVRFSLFIEIDDGGPPMRLDARVVRQDNGSGIGSVLWGTRFVNINQEDEARILRHLHARIRNRFMAEAGSGSA